MCGGLPGTARHTGSGALSCCTFCVLCPLLVCCFSFLPSEGPKRSTMPRRPGVLAKSELTKSPFCFPHNRNCQAKTKIPAPAKKDRGVSRAPRGVHSSWTLSCWFFLVDVPCSSFLVDCFLSCSGFLVKCFGDFVQAFQETFCLHSCLCFVSCALVLAFAVHFKQG